MWNFIGDIKRSGLPWYDRHMFFINDNDNRELRGRWFLILAGIIYLGGQYEVQRLMH